MNIDIGNHTAKIKSFFSIFFILTSTLGQTYLLRRSLPYALNQLPTFIGFFYLMFNLFYMETPWKKRSCSILLFLSGISGGCCWILYLIKVFPPPLIMIIYLIGQISTAFLVEIWIQRLMKKTDSQELILSRSICIGYCLCSLFKIWEPIHLHLVNAKVLSENSFYWVLHLSDFLGYLQLFLGIFLSAYFLLFLFIETDWNTQQ